MRKIIAVVGLFAASGLFAQNAGRDSFLREQAYAEMQRVGGQVDALETNLNRLSDRLGKLESGRGETAALRSETDAVKSEVAGLRRELQSTRDAVNDLIKKVNSLTTAVNGLRQQPPAPRGQTQSRASQYKGELSEYTVVSGDSLYLIASAFNTTVQALKDINQLKSDRLSIGQKVLVPRPSK